MRGVWLYNSFILCFSLFIVGGVLHNDVVVGLAVVTTGVWGILLTWIQTTNEEEAFHIARMEGLYKRGLLGWRWPFTLLHRQLTRERFHKDFQNYKWATIVLGYPGGALFVGGGIWIILRALGWTA